MIFPLSSSQLDSFDLVFHISKRNITTVIVTIMIVKTNAVLDGVTSFLKYGSLDNSNSDVSRTRWWRTPPVQCALA